MYGNNESASTMRKIAYINEIQQNTIPPYAL